MNCKSVQKFLYAFADGQLSVKANCEVLDHLKMCPACSRRVDEHQHLRKAIGRSVNSISAPPQLTARIEGSLRGKGRPLRVPHGGARTWRSAAVFIGVAAALVIAAGVYLLDFEPSPISKSPIQMAGPSARGMSGARLVGDIHGRCTSRGRGHHNPTIPENLVEVGRVIAGHFENRLAVSFPDLTPYGYQFESANYCGVDAAGSHEGGHVVYASPKSGRVSFFVSPRTDQFDAMPGTDGDDGSYRQFELPGGAGARDLAVLAWHRGATTYVACGEVDVNKLRLMVGAIRTAMGDFEERLTFAFASMKKAAQPPRHIH